MSRIETHTVEGYSYLKRPSFHMSCWNYIKSQFIWPDTLRWKGSVLLPTLPGIIVTTGFSCLVCLFHLTFAISISIPVSVLGTVSVALGLLLAFRVNTAYDRYWEGRKLIQSVMGTIRNLARQVWINIPEENDNDHLEKMRCIKLLLAFFVATKRHLRHEYGTHYEDLEQLLPPKWEPASVAKTQQFKNSSGTSKNLHVKLGNDQNIKSKAVDKKKSPKSKKAALLVSFSDAIKPTEHGEYMPSDDPADIANIRRSLIAQEFPGSTLAETPQAYLRQANPGSEPFSDDLVGQEEEEAHHTGELDDLEASVPNLAVPEAGNRNLNPSASTATTLSGEERHVHHLFNRQHRKYFTRKLDHSEFTSEEDLPYQGDSDLSLPLEILFRLALYVNQAKADGKIETPLVSVVTNSLDSLANSLTAFERIVHTPIPKAYNIHLKQAVILYIFFLPLALVDSLGWLVIPIVAIVAFTLFGIETIGAEIENPFGYDDNDLPLNKYCDELKKEVEYIIYRIPTQSTSILLDGQ